MGAGHCKGFRRNADPSSQKIKSATGECAEEYVEAVVCKQEDIKENEMKMVPLGEECKKILLIKQKGELHAIGTKCSHYGGILQNGALGDGYVRCPWHGACFNIKTGDIEDWGYDSLPCYQVNVDEDGLVHVRARRDELEANKRLKHMFAYDPRNKQTVVVVGGGAAGASCILNLRQEGFTGRIILVCREKILPYDRIKVSKNFAFNIDNALLRTSAFYEEHNIEVKLGVKAIGLSTAHKVVKLENKEELKYDFLFGCTGCRARMINIPGCDLKNIFVLREYAHAQNVHSKLKTAEHVVVLGLGFISMESAAYCNDKCASVTIVGRDIVPLRSIFGIEIGERIQKEFEAKGIKFIFKTVIKQFIAKEDDETVLDKVELTNGEILPADIAIIGIGSTYYTDWMKDSCIEMTDSGSIVVNKYLRTSAEDVYAGGDIAHAPILGSDISATIGHYALAQYHGKIAAMNICGKETPLNSVPFFWTQLLGKSYKYSGYGKFTKIKLHGSLDKLQFFAYYIHEGKVIGMSSVGADPIVSNFANLLYEGKTLTEEQINIDPFCWIRNKPKDLSIRFQNTMLISI